MPSLLLRSILALALLIGLVPTAVAAEPRPSGEALSLWMNYAYVTHDEKPVADLVEWLGDEKVFQSRPALVAPATAFLSEFFRAHPDRVEGWIAPVAGYDDMTRATFAWALWIAGRSDLARRVSPQSDVRLEGEPPRLTATHPTSPLEIDMQWGAFYASGAPVHVRNIIDALDPARPLTGNRRADDTALAAAAWTLAANSTSHEIVARVIEEEIATRPPEVKAVLEKIRAEAKARRRPFPDADGDFSAMLVIGDQSQTAEFDKPRGEAPRLTLVTRAKKNQKVFVKAVFSGQAVNDAQECRVVWDVAITDPNGKAWSGPDLKNLEALKSRVANRFDVFDARGFPTLWFEDGDVHGPYKIVAEIRDEIGGRKLTLTRIVEYVE